jgi:galactokinase
MEGTIHLRTPGRVCLFGDHQDYLGLPVIACAIDRYINLKAYPIEATEIRVDLPDLKTARTIALEDKFEQLLPNDHLGSGIRVLKQKGIELSQGYQVIIKGDLPINAGVSSSSAVMVAWIHFLTTAFGSGELMAEEIGRLAYQAEVVEHDSPGGNMDQLTIASGGLVHIDTRGEATITPLSQPKAGLVLGVSGIPKKTIGTLGSARELAQQGTAYIKEREPDFSLRNCQIAEMIAHLNVIPAEFRGAFEAAVRNHHITNAATTELKKGIPDLKRLGELMSAHHAQLRDNLKLSTPLIERMIKASKDAGGYGAKIVGSGGGGCVVALCEPGRESIITEAMTAAGAVDAFMVNISKGSTVI